MVTLLVAAAVSCFDIHQEFCTWQISDADHFNDPAWHMDTGEKLLLGMMQDSDVVERIANRIEEVFGSRTVKVRFRSSSNAEDAVIVLRHVFAEPLCERTGIRDTTDDNLCSCDYELWHCFSEG